MRGSPGVPDPAPTLPPDTDPRVETSVYVTADVPPVPGRIKERPEDFLVEENPLYAPCGTGEHIYLFIEKRGLSTFELVKRLARHFRVSESAIGYAGMKDKQAVTRQVFSIHAPGRRFDEFPMIRDDRITVLWADRHVNKLRMGHLRGNRFSIRIRGVPIEHALRARRVLERLAATGVPNRVGEQRFGILRNNHLIGRAYVLGDHAGALDLLLGPCEVRPDLQPAGRDAFRRCDFEAAARDYPATARAELAALRHLARGATHERAFAAIPESVRRYYLTAFQSAIFNAVLDERVRAGTFGALLVGDVAFKHENRALFDVDADVLAHADTPARLARIEISPTGPMWGPEMKRARGAIDESERAALRRFGVSEEDLAAFAARSPGLMQGARRPLRVPVIDPDVEAGADQFGTYIRCAFELPRGAFATVVLREIIKPGPGVPLEGPEHAEEG
jgi:tRNA pseudouridine13 synthase